MKRLMIIAILTAALASFVATSVGAWSTGIGIIDNNVPQVAKDPSVIFKDPVHAVTDLAAKTGCYRCDTVIEKAVPAKQREIANAIIVTGFVTSPLGPVGNIITLGVLVGQPNQEVQNREVPVHVEPAPAGKEYVTIVDCLVQRPGNRIEAYAVKRPIDAEKFSRGDYLTITAAKVCTEYDVADVHAVSKVRMQLNGASTDEFAKDQQFKYFYIGTAA